jgi:hypothetical protein
MRVKKKKCSVHKQNTVYQWRSLRLASADEQWWKFNLHRQSFGLWTIRPSFLFYVFNILQNSQNIWNMPNIWKINEIFPKLQKIPDQYQPLTFSRLFSTLTEATKSLFSTKSRHSCIQILWLVPSNRFTLFSWLFYNQLDNFCSLRVFVCLLRNL